MKWAEWFKAEVSSFTVELFQSQNHEYNPKTKLSIQWRPQFTPTVVSELPERLHETVYTVEYQGMQVIVLNSNELIKEQTSALKSNWRKRVLGGELLPIITLWHL